jgi:hypothetical protein
VTSVRLAVSPATGTSGFHNVLDTVLRMLPWISPPLLSTVQYEKPVNWCTGVKKLLKQRTLLSYGTVQLLQSSGNLTDI